MGHLDCSRSQRRLGPAAVTGGERSGSSVAPACVARCRSSGAKNSALKLMAVALLAVGPDARCRNVPAIVDVTIMAELLRRLGLHGRLRRRTPAWSRSTCRSGSATGPTTTWSGRCAPRSRVLGPLVARCGQADVAVPGGDAIGSRGLDLHAAGLETLGATVHVDPRLPRRRGAARAARRRHPAGLPERGRDRERPHGRGPRLRRHPADRQRGPRAGDRRHRRACSTEMGARITGAGTSMIEVEGVDGAAARRPRRRARPHRAGTWAFAAATTRGDIEVVGGVADHLTVVLDALAHAGAEVATTRRGFRVSALDARPSSFDVATLPYPGFPTDLQPFALAYDAVADGQRDDHREPLRGALPHGAGAGPARRRRAGRRPPRRWSTASTGSPARRSRPATSGPAPPS